MKLEELEVLEVIEVIEELEVLEILEILDKTRNSRNSRKIMPVPSAQAGLTSLFGMGRGGTPPLSPPDMGDIYYRLRLFE